jgi:uncharacterized small protein (DUF1192 family)
VKAQRDYAVSAKDNAVAALSNAETAANFAKDRAASAEKSLKEKEDALKELQTNSALVVKERDDLKDACDALALRVDDLNKQVAALTQDLDRQKAEVGRLKAAYESPVSKKPSSKPVALSDLDETSQAMLSYLFRNGSTNIYSMNRKLKLMDGDLRMHIDRLSNAKLIVFFNSFADGESIVLSRWGERSPRPTD